MMMVENEPVFVSPAATFKSPPVEKSIAEEIISLENCIEFLEKIWLEDANLQQEIAPDNWWEFIDALYDSLFDLKTKKVPIE